MAKAFLKLNTRKVLKNGLRTVYICVGYGTDLYLSTGVSIDPKDWDAKTCLYTGKGAKRVNDTLAALLTRVNNTILDLRETGTFEHLTKAKLKTLLTGVDTGADNSDALGPIFEKVIATKSKRNAELYTATLKKLTSWRDDIYETKFSKITKSWLTDFCASMAGLAVNTKAIHLRNLRNVFNYAIDENITKNYPFRNFHIQTEDTPMRVLPIEKFRFLRDMSGLSVYDTEHRDIFLLMFYLIGINIIDLSRLTSENLVNGRIEYRRAKTGKLYSIKVTPEAEAILTRYKGVSHLLRVFDRYASYKDYAQHLNNALRRFGPTRIVNGRAVMQPLEKGITSYWARYSWATYAASLDIPKDTISEALGHEYGSRVTGVYIKFSLDKVDAANRTVIDYLNEK